MRLDELVRYCDDYLNVRTVRDAPQARNGLQVANSGSVSRLAVSVDLCEATIQMAVAARADLLVVHHGLFWDGAVPLVGPQFARVAGLIRHDLALYSAHLPLDCHPDVGNAAVLARQLGVAIRGGFGIWHEQVCGVWGEVETSRDDFAQRLGTVLGLVPRALPFGPDAVRRVGIATGAGGSFIPQAAEAGLDTFVTGEGTHHTYLDAEELHLNVFYGGHYATETFGVKALAAHLSTQFGLPWTFLDHPTGL
jgi:dinuclear metal center YbgI/SA1388 family protein